MTTTMVVWLVGFLVVAAFVIGFFVGVKHKERALFTKSVLKDTVDKLSGKG